MNVQRRSRGGAVYGLACLVMGVAAGAILAAHPHPHRPGWVATSWCAPTYCR